MILIRNEFKKLRYKKSSYLLLIVICNLLLLFAFLTRYTYNELYGDDWRKSLLDTNKSLTALLEDEKSNNFFTKEMTELILINDYYLENNIDPSRPDYLKFLSESRDLATFIFIACIFISSTIITHEYDEEMAFCSSQMGCCYLNKYFFMDVFYRLIDSYRCGLLWDPINTFSKYN